MNRNSAHSLADVLLAADGALSGQLEVATSENATLGAVIRTLNASLELDKVLAGVVKLLSDATRCHACFVYSLEAERLVLRAASPQYRSLVDDLSIGADEGLVGWVARTGDAEFIREAAMEDPRMKVIPELDEERFQSLVAAPIVGRDRSTIGVISLHTIAPREFEPEVLDYLVSSASLIGGAIENAQKHAATKHHVQKLKILSRATAAITSSETEAQLCENTVSGVRQLFENSSCQIYLSSATETGQDRGLRLAAHEIAEADQQPADSAEFVATEVARAGSPPQGKAAKFTIPLCVTDEQIGLLVASDLAITDWEEEDRELLRALAKLTSVALERIALIKRLASRGSFAELIAAIRSGDVSVALTMAAALGASLELPYVMLVAQMPAEQQRRPTANSARASFNPNRSALAELKTDLGTAFPGSLSGLIGDRLISVVPIPDGTDAGELQRRAETEALKCGVAIGIGPVCGSLDRCAAGLAGAQAAAETASYLYRDGGLLPSEQLGAYSVLVGLDLETVGEGDPYVAIEKVANYDLKNNQRSQLLLTLERYLAEGRKVTASANALFIHPNTLRQRLARIESVSGLTLADEDLLALALTLKLVRLKLGIAGEPPR